MRRLLHLTLTLCFSLYVMSLPVMWGVYYVFADQIAASYCVNRTNPCCHGKCHVGRMADQQQKQSSPAASVNIEKDATFLIVETVGHVVESSLVKFIEVPEPPPSDGYLSDIYHPPLHLA